MQTRHAAPDLINPPEDVRETGRGDWQTAFASDPVVAFLDSHYSEHHAPTASWETARLSRAVYVYRNTVTPLAIVAKFYTVKMGEKAEHYARREFRLTQQAVESGLAKGTLRAVRPLTHWRGVLFLEYVDGLTLEDTIAVRRSRPGTLLTSLGLAARLLATLHTGSPQSEVAPDFGPPVAYARKIVNDLVRWGVLETDPVVRDGLITSIDRWVARDAMAQFSPALTHGDATTTNFIFPWDGDAVAVDWERLYVADPAADLGRLMAEVSHSVKQHGGSVSEAVDYVDQLARAYCEALSNDKDANALLDRARFYRASSTLRIARNGWVSRLDRIALVAQALALLNT
jgi:thiamine kinase-like enzyme